ncbi:MAG: hypothetical protein IE916_02185 [Epsilonproteobacteria bacterium]|nr:hypothetical protein [Campylobacterota bacterium]
MIRNGRKTMIGTLRAINISTFQKHGISGVVGDVFEGDTKIGAFEVNRGGETTVLFISLAHRERYDAILFDRFPDGITDDDLVKTLIGATAG